MEEVNTADGIFRFETVEISFYRNINALEHYLWSRAATPRNARNKIKTEHEFHLMKYWKFQHTLENDR